jgi:F0F1-type ATP synthase assembly protein I
MFDGDRVTMSAMIDKEKRLTRCCRTRKVVQERIAMTSQPPSEDPKRKAWAESMRGIARYTNLGWTIVAAVVLGLLGGHWLDKQWNTAPLMFVLGAVLGIAAGLYHFLATVLRK